MLNTIYVNENDKVMFLQGLVRLSKIDGTIDEGEVVFLRNLAMSMSVAPEKISFLEYQLKTADAEFSKMTFTNKKQAIFFLEEAIQLCYIDGFYHEKEKAEINAMAVEMGLQATTVVAVEQWIEEAIAWRKRGEELLALED